LDNDYRTVVLGAGLAGLSAAYHLENSNYLVLEKESEVGGLCGSVNVKDYTFDFGTHTYFTSDQYVTDLINDLIPDQLYNHQRSAYILKEGGYIKYPFEANLHSLPPEIVKECIEGIEGRDLEAKNTNFKDWIHNNFGTGIARHYMVPYAEKIWKYPLDQMDTDWIGDKVPGAKLEDVVNGSKGELEKEFGFNVNFSYPKEGGFGTIPTGFADRLNNIQCSARLASIVPNEDGYLQLEYEVEGAMNNIIARNMISTIPLPELINIIRNVPTEVVNAAKNLIYTQLLSVGLGVAGEKVSDMHWLYIPESKYIFNRLSFPKNLSKSTTPEGKSAVLAEVTFKKDHVINVEDTVEKVTSGLIDAGILTPDHDIEVIDSRYFKFGYVIHDLERSKNIEIIHRFLNRCNIIPAGRWGEWKYFNLDKAIQSGRIAANKINVC
jgi:UDP-galactopyranose mutase